MKQILKETIILWIVGILVLALVCAVVGVPFLFITYTGIGKELQVIVCVLWFTFWLSLVITVGTRIGDKESEE